jgi:hypothetical protein
MSDAVADSIRAVNSLSRPPAILAREPAEHPDKLFKTISAARLLKQQVLELLHVEAGGELTPDDLQTIADTVEGELDIEGAVRFGLKQMSEAAIFVTGLSAEIDTMRARKARFERRVESIRGLILQALTVAERQKVTLDLATVSYAPARPRVEVDQESEIPSQFFKVPDPVLDKAGLSKTMLERHKAIEAVRTGSFESDEARDTALLRVFKSMPPIPGCHIEEGGSVLTIRPK